MIEGSTGVEGEWVTGSLDGGNGIIARSWCRWRNFVGCHRLRRVTSFRFVLEQLDAGCLICQSYTMRDKDAVSHCD